MRQDKRISAGNATKWNGTRRDQTRRDELSLKYSKQAQNSHKKREEGERERGREREKAKFHTVEFFSKSLGEI